MIEFFSKNSDECTEYESIERIINFVERRYSKRKIRERHLQQVVGNREKKSFLYRLDLMLEYSGLRKHIRFANSEVVISFSCIVGFIIYFVTSYFTNNIYIGIFSMMTVCMVLYIFIYTLSGIYFNRMEKNIMTFLNLIENFSKSEDDIVQIFKKSMLYMSEPFDNLLREFCTDAENLGDTNQAFDNMISKIEHNKCRELLRNLEVCSRYEANYEDIVKDCRSSMIDYLNIKSERKAIISNGRIEVIILLVGAALITLLFAGITDNMWSLLTTTFIGGVIILYCFVVVIVCIVMMLRFDKNTG